MARYVIIRDGARNLIEWNGDQIYRAALEEDGWAFHAEADAPPAPAPPDTRTLEEARKAKRDAIAARRWAAQTNMAYDGVQPVAYGADTAGNLMATMSALGAQPQGAIAPWKLGAGAFRAWTLPQFQMFFAAGMAHVAGCFAREAQLNVALDACADVAAVDALDIETGWPG